MNTRNRLDPEFDEDVEVGPAGPHPWPDESHSEDAAAAEPVLRTGGALPTPTRDGLADPEVETSPDSSQQRVHALTKVLRTIGATVVAASAATFLFQQWEKGDDLTRYFALLAQAGVLSAIGFFCAVRIRESKSARTFMALAAGMVPALFCILGGLVYSQFSLDGPIGEVAGYATWRAPSPGAALATALATLVAVAPVALLSFLSLARSQAKLLAFAFLAGNAAMLFPSRAPELMAGLVAFLLGGLGFLEYRFWRHESAMRTREGWIVRAMVALPMVLIVLRSFVHYELSLYMASVMSFAIAALFFLYGRGQTGDTAGRSLERATVAPAAVGWITFSVAVHQSFGLTEATLLPLSALPLAATLIGLSFAARSEDASGYRQSAVTLSVLAMAANLLLVHGILAAFLALVSGIVGIAYGFFFERKGLLALGAITTAAALLTHVGYAIELYAHLHWSSLSVLGIAVILGASLIERHHATMTEHMKRVRRRAQRFEST